MLLLIIMSCMRSIYLRHSIYNYYDATNSYIFLYYNLHAINTYGILLMITNNKKITKYNNYKSGKREHFTFKTSGVFLIHISIDSCICFWSIFVIFEVPLVLQISTLNKTWNKLEIRSNSTLAQKYVVEMKTKAHDLEFLEGP